MIFIYYTLIISVFALVILNLYELGYFCKSRRNSKLPVKGHVTMFDVRHLLMEGERELAIQAYCEIFQTTPLKAKKDIAELERSLKV